MQPKVLRVFCQYRAQADGFAPGSAEACSSSCQCLSRMPEALRCPSAVLPELAQTQSYIDSDVLPVLSQAEKKVKSCTSLQ